jgi:hypothetical protein
MRFNLEQSWWRRILILQVGPERGFITGATGRVLVASLDIIVVRIVTIK